MPLSDVLTATTSLVRRFVTTPPMATYVDMTDNVAIVTGASPGSIGYETAKTLASWGTNVVISTRSRTDTVVSQLQQDCGADAGQISGHPLDLTQTQSVEAFVAWFRSQHGDTLHLLINNAGIHADILGSWKAPHLCEDGIEIHWRTNYLGPMHLTHRLLPLLEHTGTQQAPARVVFVASHLHVKGENQALFEQHLPYSSWQTYGQSKLGLVHAAFELHKRYCARHINGYVLHPGSIATNIALKGMEDNPVMKRLLEIVNPLQMWFMLTPTQGAQTQLYCATQPGLPGGRYYDRCAAATPNPQAANAEVSKRLWEETHQWIRQLPDATSPISKRTACESSV